MSFGSRRTVGRVSIRGGCLESSSFNETILARAPSRISFSYCALTPHFFFGATTANDNRHTTGFVATARPL